MGPLTIILMGICVAVALLLGLPPKTPLLWLSSGDPERLPAGNPARRGLAAHHADLHSHVHLPYLLFNMLWLKDLGSMIEARQGSFKLLLLVLVIGIGSNLGQNLVGGPMFGGMSGVFTVCLATSGCGENSIPLPACGSPSTVVMMLGWFLLCVNWGDSVRRQWRARLRVGHGDDLGRRAASGEKNF
jgi:GlpG protein